MNNGNNNNGAVLEDERTPQWLRSNKTIGRPFSPGVSGNPGGRRKKRLTQVLEWWWDGDPRFEDVPEHQRKIVLDWVDCARHGDAQARQQILDRLEGKVTDTWEGRIEQQQSVSASNLDYSKLTDDELREMTALIEKATPEPEELERRRSLDSSGRIMELLESIERREQVMGRWPEGQGDARK